MTRVAPASHRYGVNRRRLSSAGGRRFRTNSRVYMKPRAAYAAVAAAAAAARPRRVRVPAPPGAKAAGGGGAAGGKGGEQGRTRVVSEFMV